MSTDTALLVRHYAVTLVIACSSDNVSCCVSKELCLQTKLLAPSSCPVAEFLSKAPQPPPAHVIRNAVQMLKVTSANKYYYIPHLILISDTRHYTHTDKPTHPLTVFQH